MGFENCKYQCYSNAKKDDEGAEEVCKEKKGGEEDAGESDPEVAEQLLCDHLVSLPVAVLLPDLKWIYDTSNLRWMRLGCISLLGSEQRHCRRSCNLR